MNVRTRVIVPVAVCLAALLLAAGPAFAARPAAGGHYYGFPAVGEYSPGLVQVTAELRVSRSGRRLTAARLSLGCEVERSGRIISEGLRRVRLSFRGDRQATIRRDGTFRVLRRVGRRRYRLAGRFITPKYARLSYRARVPARTVEEHGRIIGRITCKAGSYSPAALYRDGVPPFSGCDSQRAQTLLRTETGRVFEQVLSLGGGEFFPHVYACLFESPSKRFDLGRNWDDERVDTFRLAGPFVAFFQGGCANCIFDQWSIKVVDLRDGSLGSRPGVPYGSRLYDLALEASGSVAWTLDRIAIGNDGYPKGYPGPPVIEAREVWALDSRGQRLIDTGPELVLDSLELNGSTLYWLNGGTARSATLE